jgi:hypothetical protein
MKKGFIPMKGAYFAFAALILLGSCTKETAPQSISVEKTKTQDDNYYFYWETATNMPVSPNSTVQVPMPWSSQSGSYIDPALVSDYKRNDGWELVYNTFNPNVYPYASQMPPGGLYFALYNKFRGLLRFYLYIPSGLFGNSTNIEHGLAVYSDNGTPSKLLNFDAVEIVDPNASATAFTKTNNTGIAVGGGWYAMQYQIAYDPNFASTTYPHLGFTWNSKTVNISQIVLDGTLQGTITGNITQPSSGINWSGTLTNLATGLIEGFTAAGAQNGGFNSTSGTLLQNAAAGGLVGNFTGFLTGLFGGNSANSSEVDLSMNANISLQGTLTGSQPLVPNAFVFPGQTIANTVGAPNPLYTSPLGVFNISNRPQVRVVGTAQPQVGNEPFIQNRFTLLTNSYSIQINPAVSSLATVQVVSTDVLIPSNIANAEYGKIVYNMTKEYVGNISYFYKVNPTADSYLLGYDTPVAGTVVVRIVLKVTPNNGAPASTIVKSFLANIVN